MKLNHVIESQQFTVPLLMELFDRTRQMEKIVVRGGTKDYASKIMATLFYKSSTRTRFSFEAAMYRLGGRVISTEHAADFSSEMKDEMLEDTIRIISNDCDVIVLRHTEEGAAHRAAAVSSVPVINAGDGSGGQHPTQALLDLYTIYRECKALNGISIAFVGALDAGRTVRSLTYLLSKFDRVKFYFIAPPEMQIGKDILHYLENHRVEYELLDQPESIIAGVDVLYRTRIDRSKLAKKDIDLTVYNINAGVLQKMKSNAIIMHPLPRSVEIDPVVDNDPRAVYFRQACNGLYVRMALLTILLDHE
jgi:aspartate carbamoyltransferase catalytic subunit